MKELEKEAVEEKAARPKKSELRAKKDHFIFCPRDKEPVERAIKKGDDVSDLPKDILSSLKSEGVI